MIAWWVISELWNVIFICWKFLLHAIHETCFVSAIEGPKDTKKKSYNVLHIKESNP
jgi:hypothetical protein